MEKKYFFEKIMSEADEEYQKKWLRRIVIILIIAAIVGSFIYYNSISKMYSYSETTGTMMAIVDGVEQETNMTMNIMILLSILEGGAVSCVIVSFLILIVLYGGILISYILKRREQKNS